MMSHKIFVIMRNTIVLNVRTFLLYKFKLKFEKQKPNYFKQQSFNIVFTQMKKIWVQNSHGVLAGQGPSIKDVGNLAVFDTPIPPCRNFDPDLSNFYLLISCNIGIQDPYSPFPKIFRRILWKTLVPCLKCNVAF